MHVASASEGFNYYPSKDTYGNGYDRDYYLRTMFTCSNLDCDYYDRFLCRRHALFIRAFHYKPVCPACSSEVLHTSYWDPTNYRRVFVNGRINREVLPTQNNSFATDSLAEVFPTQNNSFATDRSRISRMIQSLDLPKRLNLKTSDDFTLCLATVAFEYNLEVELGDLRKICIINSVIDAYINAWYSNLRNLIETEPRISYSDRLEYDIRNKISGFINEISEIMDKMPYYSNRKLMSEFKDKTSDFINEISEIMDKMPSYQNNRREWICGLKDQLSYYSFYDNFPDDNPFSYFDEKISKIKATLSRWPRYSLSYFYDSSRRLYPRSSIGEIVKLLSPHLISPTSLPEFNGAEVQ